MNREDKEMLVIIGQIAAGLAHEIKNPLTAIKGYGQLLRKNYRHDSRLQGYSEVVLGEVDKITKTLDNFLLLAEPLAIDKQEANLGEIVHQVAAMVSPMAYLQNVTVDCKVDKRLPPCIVDGGQIKQALIYMCENALDAMPSGGKLILRAYLADIELCLEITDTGCGITPAAMGKVGTPFYTTKNGGTGLSLSRAYAFVKAHQGKIDCSSVPGQGTRFRIRLPYDAVVVTQAAATLTAEG